MIVEKSNLTAALQIALRCVDKRSGNPALSQLEIVAADGKLHFSGTNVDSTVFVSVPVEADKGEHFWVDAQLLSRLVKHLGDTVEMTTGKHLYIKRAAGKAQLALGTGKDWPKLPEFDGSQVKRATFAAADLRMGLQASLCGTDEVKGSQTPWQNVVQLKTVDGRFRILASDGKRVATVFGPCTTNGDFSADIPVKAVRTIWAILGDLKDVEQVMLCVDRHHVWLWVSQDLRVVFRTSTVEFPDFEAYFAATKFEFESAAPADAVDDALDLVSTLVDEKLLAFRLEARPGAFTFATETKDRGSIEHAVEVEYLGPDFVTGYNVDYLAPVFQMLKFHLQTKAVRLDFAEDRKVAAGLVNYPLRISAQMGNVEVGWVVQSLNKFPRRVDEQVAEAVAADARP